MGYQLPSVAAVLDERGRVVVRVRNDLSNGDIPNYRLPSRVRPEIAGRILGIEPAEAVQRARTGSLPVRVVREATPEGTYEPLVPVLPLVHRFGIAKVRAHVEPLP